MTIFLSYGIHFQFLLDRENLFQPFQYKEGQNLKQPLRWWVQQEYDFQSVWNKSGAYWGAEG